jgi:DNA-binding NarL/FixJ family response regulator
VSALGKVDSMPEHQPRILIADDNVDTRYILSDFLARQGYETITASSGEKALALAARLPLDLALLDVVMPGPLGIELAARLKGLQPQIEVILITAYGSLEQAVEAMRQGIFYYLAKPLELRQVLAVVEKAWVKQQARAQVLAEETPEMLGALRGLSCREREVLALLAEGRIDPEIAEALCISTYTASTHVRNLLGKLKVKNRVQAVVLWDRYRRKAAAMTGSQNWTKKYLILGMDNRGGNVLYYNCHRKVQ